MRDMMIDTRPYIEVNNARAGLLNAQIDSLVMEERQGGPSHVEIRVRNTAHHAGAGINFAFEFTDTETMPLGQPFRVLFPSLDPDEDDSTPREIFAGRVSGLEFVGQQDGRAELCILGEDALMAWRMRRRSRSIEGGTAKEVLEKMAKEDALAGPLVDYLSGAMATRHQVNESDLAFLHRVLADLDADAQVVGDALQIGPRSDVQRGEVTLELGYSLRSVRIAADLAHQRETVSLSAFDGVAGTAVQVSMKTTALGPGDGRRATEYLAAFGPTVEHYSGAGISTTTEAQGLVDAVGARMARRFVVARGVAIGNPKLRVGAHVTLNGVGERFSNIYYVTQARHSYDQANGYVTEFEAECAFFKGSVPQ